MAAMAAKTADVLARRRFYRIGWSLREICAIGMDLQPGPVVEAAGQQPLDASPRQRPFNSLPSDFEDPIGRRLARA